jgi:hypothetical protein
MAKKKISAFTETTTLADADIIPVVINPGTSPASRKITKSNYRKSILAAITDPVLVKSGDGINFDTADGSDTDTDILTLDVTGTPKLFWDESNDAFALTKPLFLGDTQTTNSLEPYVNVNRAVDGAGGTNAHCFSDSSVITRSANIAYNSFDARIGVGGTANYNHFASFQAAPILNTSGTTGIVYGFIDAPTVSGGTVTKRYGLHVDEVAGAGAVTNNYGVYVEELTKGATINYAIQTAGATLSYFGGNISVGAAPALYRSICVGGAHAQVTHYGIENIATNAGSQVGFSAKGTTTGAGNITLIMSLYAQMTHDSNGSLANFYGVYCGGVNNGGTTAAAHAIYIADMTGTGAVTAQYGVHVKELTKGGTTNYAIYTEGATPSLFTGPVTVGGLTLADATNITLNTTTGSQIGTAAAQKLGFFGAAPVVQQTKAGHNNWGAIGDVVDALVSLGLFDAA